MLMEVYPQISDPMTCFQRAEGYILPDWNSTGTYSSVRASYMPGHYRLLQNGLKGKLANEHDDDDTLDDCLIRGYVNDVDLHLQVSVGRFNLNLSTHAILERPRRFWQESGSWSKNYAGIGACNVAGSKPALYHYCRSYGYVVINTDSQRWSLEQNKNV